MVPLCSICSSDRIEYLSGDVTRCRSCGAVGTTTADLDPTPDELGCTAEELETARSMFEADQEGYDG